MLSMLLSLLYKVAILIIGIAGLTSCATTPNSRIPDEELFRLFALGDAMLTCESLACASAFNVKFHGISGHITGLGSGGGEFDELLKCGEHEKLAMEVMHTSFPHNLTWYYLGRAAEELGYVKAAAKYYRNSLNAPLLKRKLRRDVSADTKARLAKLEESGTNPSLLSNQYGTKMSLGLSVDARSELKKAEELNAKVLRLSEQGKYSEAIPLAQQAMEIGERTCGPDDPLTAAAMNNLAFLMQVTGNLEKARHLYSRTLEIRERTLGSGHPLTAKSLNDLAGVHRAAGHYDEAESSYRKALQIREKVLGFAHPDTGATINNLAVLYHSMGDYGKAEPLYRRALETREKLLGAQHPETARSLNNLAALYSAVGDYGKAEPFYRRALEIREKTLGHQHPDTAQSLSNLAVLYHTLGEYNKAEALYKRAFEISGKVFGSEHTETARSLNNFAFLYLDRSEVDKAFHIFKAHNSHAGLGRCYLAKRDFSKAKEEFFRALKTGERNGSKESVIGCCIGLGLASEGLLDYAGSRKHFSRAIDLIETQRKELDLISRELFYSGKVGAGFSRLEPYEGMIRVFYKERPVGYEKEALRYAERVKSRILREMLAVRGIRGRGEVDSKLLMKDREFQTKLNLLGMQLRSLEELGNKGPEGRKGAVHRELDQVLEQYESFLREVEVQNPELASLITTTVPEVEKPLDLVGTDADLVVFFTGKENTYAWLLTFEQIRMHEIQIGEDQLNEMVNALLLSNLSNQPRRPEPIIVLAPAEKGESSKVAMQRNRDRFLDAAKEFHHVLFAPLQEGMKTKRLIVVPHGALHKVPFSALHDGSGYLVDRYELTVLPSVSTIPYVVQKRNPDNGRLLAFGNPETDHAPLGFAEVEVERLANLFPERDLLVKERATEEEMKDKCHIPDVIHFACHGELSDSQPLQSGLLLAHADKEDGKLQVHEIFGLDIGNTNLVALSACETALGKITSGDDMVGLSRAFIYAGTPSLLASLWEVDDESTASLMEGFYENWRKKGMSKPQALRQAQISIKAVPQYQHPYFWAAFELIGDWK